MRTVSLVALLAFAAGLSGCAMSPRPARTEVKPGESEILSERDERRPSETRLRIRAVTPSAPSPEPQEPPVRIRLILPQGTQPIAPPAPEDPKDGGR
jgi:hypothetical protein